ncbi:MAG TPA: Gfo/Idh/MocA family oxidoreductase [Opitutaceae bacterium]|nr:Gfo/Idh/MocA family oxidoreductase [Opitutaceae bacterium]
MITLAQIGCGYWGPNLLRNFSALPEARVKYVVEASAERRAYVRANYPKVEAVDRLETALDDPAVQAVVLATPAATHAELARRALESGRHVFVEKPLALAIGEVDRIDALARARKLTLMVGHTFLYNPAVLALKEIIDRGDLGRIYYLYAQRLNLGVVRADVNALWNLAPHDISIFNFLLGAAPVAVTAQGADFLQPGIEDVVFATFEYPGGIRASLQVSWLDPQKVRKVTLVGSRRMVVYDDVADDKLAIYDKGIDAPGRDHVALPFDQPGTARLVYRSGEIQRPKLPPTEPLAAAARDFIEAIRDRRPPRADAAGGRAVVAALQAASLSLRENSRRVQLEEILRTSAA